MAVAICELCGTEFYGMRAYPSRAAARFCSRLCANRARNSKPVSKEWLEQKYLIEGLDCPAIAHLVSRDPKRVWEWLREYQIPIRSRGWGNQTPRFKKGEPSLFRGHKQKSGPESPFWRGGITAERQAFYASDQWKSVARIVYGRAGARCERCGATRNSEHRFGRKLHLHHIAPFEILALRADEANLAALCRGNSLPFPWTQGELDVADLKVLDQARGERWALYHADACEILAGLKEGSVHYSLHSPPFMSLYTFSDDPRDLSNCANDETFWEHFRFVIAQLFRVTMPGRLASIHCMNLPTSKLRDGFIGLRDFRGDIIRAFEGAGFYYHSEVVIRKDPVSAMQRSKSIGLLHKQVVKDSSLSRQAVADYVVTMRKPGDNPLPIKGQFTEYHGTGDMAAEDPGIESAHIAGSYSVKVWQRYAEPVWMDIAQSDVLSNRVARAEEDERHIAPLQLTVIRRCYQIWTNPGDVVLSPFAGIGSEGYVAIEMGRRFIGIELKESYYKQAVANLASGEKAARSGTLLDLMAAL